MSICIPTYNGETYLRECIESALQQTVADFEVLIVDDCSRDSSVRIASEYAHLDSRIEISVNRHNLGLAGNWNRCVELSRGEWVKFLFQDDRLEPRCLERMLAAIRRDSLISVCRRVPLFDQSAPDRLRRDYESYIAEHNLARRFPGMSFITSEAFADHMVDYPTANCIGEPTSTLIHRSAFERFGEFHPDLVQLIDWEYEARVALQTGLSYVDEALVVFRVHGKSSTARGRETAAGRYHWEIVDPLLVLHDIVYSRFYARVRVAAQQRLPPCEFFARLVDAVDCAEAMAESYEAEADWKGIRMRYPRLTRAPIGRQIKRWIRRTLPGPVLSRARRVRALVP